MEKCCQDGNTDTKRPTEYRLVQIMTFIDFHFKPSQAKHWKMYRTASCKKKKKNIGILTSEFIKVNYLTTLSLDVCTVCVDQSNI